MDEKLGLSIPLLEFCLQRSMIHLVTKVARRLCASVMLLLLCNSSEIRLSLQRCLGVKRFLWQGYKCWSKTSFRAGGGALLAFA